MLRTTESYLFRRSVCDVATNGLNKFFSSLIARLNAVRDDGGGNVQFLAHFDRGIASR